MTTPKKFGSLVNTKTGEVLMEMIGPGRDEDVISIGLRILTHQLILKHPEQQSRSGLFGGRYGYGVDFENDVFEMHYDRQDYDCTCGASEPKHADHCDEVTQRRVWLDARLDFATIKKTDKEREAQIEADVSRGMPRNMAILGSCSDELRFERFEEYEQLHPYPACSCGVLVTWKESHDHARDCQQSIANRPNFTHKASGLEIRWYKYIGRDNEVNQTDLTMGAWREILEACLHSIHAQTVEQAMTNYADAEREEANAHKEAMKFWTS